MKAADFQRLLREEGLYETPGRRLQPPAWLATALFHTRMAGIFVRGHFDARWHADFENTHFGDFGLMTLKMVESLGVRARYEGFEKVRGVQFPVVWVANHMSPLETYILPMALMAFSPLTIILKESLAHYPVFGRVVRSIHTIRLKRENAMEDLRTTLEQGTKALAEGRSVLVFPEGRRSRTFDPSFFNSIGVKLAQRGKAPLVPVALRTDALQIGRKWRDAVSLHPRRPVHFACGEAVSPGDPRAALETLRGFIVGKLGEWQAEYDAGVPLIAPEGASQGGKGLRV